MKKNLPQVVESKQLKCNCLAQRVKMATLKIRMVIGLMALLIGGFGLEGSAHGLAGDRTPAGRQYNVCSNYAHHLTVAGNLPVTANVTAVPVKADAPDGQPAVAAFDITITNGGREWQPAPGDPVFVTLADQKFVDGKLLDIYHQGPDGPEFVATVMPKNGTITFPAYSFSVYIVTETGDDARLQVNFHQNATDVVSIYVKKADITNGHLNTVVYDPGVGVLAEGVQFRGWITKEDYTATDLDNAKSIEGVRDSITQRLNAGIHDGDVLDFYAMLFYSYVVSYLDDHGATLGADDASFRADAASTSVSYTVNMGYVPQDGEHNFMGWFAHTGGENIEGWTEGTNYANPTTIIINGDVTFRVNAPEGHWLVFDENGKGGTYNAPQFVLNGENTVQPALATQQNMVRKGYTFAGWYTGKPSEVGGDPTGPQFVFGHPITERTTIYAKWTPTSPADYTVVLWTQNQNRDGGYVVAGSYIGQGAINTNIPYTVVDNGAEDYVTGVGANNGHYTGFGLTEASKNQQVVIKPEGDAVLNLYFDRIEYDFKFYLYRERNNNNNKYSTPLNSGSGAALDNLVTWSDNNNTEWTNNHPTTNFNLLHETYNGNEYYYFVMHAYYGEDISSKWPKYDEIQGFGNRQPVSFVMMVGTKLKPTATNQGSGTVKGLVTVLDENILGATNDPDGNYVMVRFPSSYYNWRYHIWFEALPGETYTTTHTWNGKTYYPADTLVVRSSNTTVTNQNAPKYTGFEFEDWRSQNWNNRDYWTTGNNPTLYHINQVYDRLEYKINYFDGVYVDGNNNTIETHPDNLLHESPLIGQGATIAQEYRDYVPNQPAGYVFEGWYLDEGCTVPYAWDKMEVGGIIVYAKWRQIQYRVFLHPNAGTDESLDWGSETQSMNFRRSYGDLISVPTGIRNDYEFAGWYMNAACTLPFNAEVYKLNETTVTTPYDKTRDFTDDMDKWGNGATWNSDSMTNATTVRVPERFWITKKFDLYGKWRAKVEGAIGIQVVYDVTGGSPRPTDTRFYTDNAEVASGAAPTSSDPNKVFSHWVVQEWNGSAYVDGSVTVFPGSKFTVLKDNAKAMVVRWRDSDNNTYTPDEPTIGLVSPYPSYPNVDSAVYIVQLRAVYKDKEAPTPSFIVWYNNYVGAAKDTLRQDGNRPGETAHTDLHINEAVNIPAAPTRTGYTFKGWYKKRWADGQTPTAILSPAVCDPGFLYYNNVNHKYYADAAFNSEATQVAADENNPYDYLYAVWEPDTITFDIPDEFCYGAESGSYTLPTTSIEGITGTWNPASVTTTSPGTYYPVFTPDNGQCINKQVKDTITVLNSTVATINGPAEICSGQSATLSVPDVTGNTYKWSTNDPTNSIEVNPTTTTVYKVTVTSGGCESEGTHTLTVNTLPVVNSITVPTGNICPGSGPFEVTGNVTAGTGTITTYNWTGATATTNPKASVTEATTDKCDKTYTVSLKVVDNKGCESNTATNSFNVKDEAAPTIGTNDLNRTLTSNNCTFTVPDFRDTVRKISSDNCTAQAALIITQSPTAGTPLTNYGGTQKVTVTVTDLCNKSSEKEITLNIPAKPLVNISGDVNVCYNGTLSLTAIGSNGTAPLTYKWDDNTEGDILTLNNQVDTTVAKTVSVTVTDANGCTAPDDHTYNVYKPLRGGRILYEKKVCDSGDTIVQITGTTPASGGGATTSYIWQTSTDSLHWTTVANANDESYTLTGAIHHTYVRRAYVTSDCGTAYTNAVYVVNTGTVNPGNMTGGGTVAYCYGSNVNHTLTASGVTVQSGADFDYVWYTSTDGETWTRIDTASHASFTYTNPNFTESTSIWFKYAIAIANCDTIQANEKVELQVNPLPVVTITPNTTQTIALGEPIANVTVDYANSTLVLAGLPAGVTSTSTETNPVTVSGAPTTAGTYTVTATATSNTNPACGTAIDSFKIVVNDTLVLDPLSFVPSPLCVKSSETNNEITISENAGNTDDYTYTWEVGTDGTFTPSTNSKSIVAQWSSSGNKHIKLTVKNIHTNAVSHRDTIIVVHPIPAISISDIAAVCPGTEFNVKGNVTAETTAPYTYTWSTASTGLTVTPASATVTATSYTSTATATGCGETKELKLTVKDNNSCQVSTTKDITVKTPSAPTINTSLADRDWGCTAPTSVPQVSDFTVTDECNSSAAVTLAEGTEAVENCIHTKMWTASYTNACDVTVSKSITYTWKEMTTPTITTTLPLTGTKECNWNYETNGPKQSDFTVNDDCASRPSATVTPGTLDESVACQRSMTWKASYENACGMKADTVTITYTWPYDVTKPVITAFDTVATPALNCTYVMPDLSASTLYRTTDGCSTPTFVSQSINAGEIYPQSDEQQTIDVVVTVKDNCENTQTATVNVIIPAKLSVTAEADPTPICLGSSSVLTATPASATGTPTYTWTPGATLDATNVATVIATPTAAGNSTYTVTVRDENGCENTANVSVTVNDTVKLSADNLTQNICLDNAITTINITTENATLAQAGLDGTGMTLSGNTITGTPTAVGTYPYTIIATSNKTPACNAKRITGTITVKDLTVSANANNATCANNNGSATVTASDGFEPYTYSYAYKYPSATHNTEVNLSTKTTAAPTGLDTAVYVVTVTDANGCSKTAEFTVGLTNNLTVTVSAEPQHICSGGSFVITPAAPAGTKYSWELPAQDPACSPDCDYVSGTGTGAGQTTVHGENLVNNYTSTVVLTYTVVPTYGVCVGASVPVTVAVDVTTHPIPPITVRDTTVCANIGNVGLTATFANVTASVDTVSWKFLADSVAHFNAVSSSDLTDNYTAAVPATPCNNQTYPYVVYYADEYGCHSQATANVIVSLPATITITGGTNASTVECVSDTVAPHLITPSVMPTVKDACDNDISDQWTLTRPTNKVECEGTMAFVYTYKNCDDKTATWTYTYDITRTTPPAEDGGPVATTAIVECVSAATAPATLPVVKDVCGNELTNPTLVKTENIANCEGTVTYTYTYKDCVDSQFVWNFVYTIDRTTAPTVNATGIEAAKTVDCIDKATAPTTIPTATGKCEDTPITGVLTRTVDNPNPLTCEGTRTYTYTYTDCANQTATWSYVYTIEAESFADPTDVTKDVACIADTFAPHTNATLMPTVKDNCNGDIAPTLPPTKTVDYDGCSGTVAYTYLYEDCEGNTQDWTYTYNIAKPTAPALTGTWPSDQTNVNSCYADRPAFPTKAAVKALYTASCGKTLTVDSVETVVDNDNCGWEIQCKYTITDGCTPVNHTITYKGGDKTKPVIATGYTTTLPANVTSCNYTYPDFTTSVKSFSNDNCTAQANLTVTQSPAANDPITQTTSAQTLPVKVYVADACGNKDSVTVTVTVPASLALTIDTSASDCYNTADGFLNYTITGGVANYTLELTKTETTIVTDTKTAASSYSFTGLADGTYSLTVTDANGCEATASTTIQQINTTLYIVANSHSWTYDGSAHSDNGYKVTFGSESHTGTSGNDVTLNNGDVITNVTVTGSITNVTESPVANALGTGIKVMRGTRDVTCFYNIDTTFGKLTITNSDDLSLNCFSQSKTFDGDPLSYTAVPTVTTGTTVLYSADTMRTWSTTVPSITNVSESPLKVYVKAENSNYATAYCDYTLTINPAPLTIKLDSTKVYDGTVFVSPYAATGAGYTVTGLVSGDAVTAGAVTSSGIHKGDYVYDATATISTPFATTKGIGNYNVTYDLTQHIVCRDVTLTSATASRKYNGENLSNHTVTVSGSGWLSGKEATYGNFASIKNKGSVKNAFTYTLASGEVATDYCVTIDTGMLTVTCRVITITAASQNYSYDGNSHSNSAFTVIGDGMVSDESVTPVISGSIQFPSQSPQTNAITSYTFTPASTTDNYCVTTVNGTLTMECVSKTIVITADNGEWTYDGTTHTQKSYKLTVDGGTPITVPLSANGDYKFPNGDSLHVTISGEVKNVTTGVNNVVAGWTLYHGDENLLAASNNCYNISKVDGTLKVNCRHITLTSGSASKTYNGSELKKETVTIGGDGMAPNETLSYTNFASITNVGSTSNTFSYNFVSPALASNYCVTPVNGTLTVDCKEVTLTAKNADKTYDGSPLTQSGFTASALETGDTHTFTVTMTSGSTITNVGTQANVIATVDGTPVITGVRTAVGNYCVTTVEGSLEVKKKDLTITANSDSKVYDGTPLTNSGYSNTALAPTDHIESVVVTGSQTPVGTSNNVPSDAVIKNANNEDVTGNYNITYQNGKLTVTSNTTPIVIASGTNSWMYNGVAHSEETYTVTYGGTPVTDVDATGKIFTLPTGDKVTITNPNSITNVSETADNNNTYSYSIQNSTYYTSVTANYGKLTITPRTVELTSATDSKVYDGTALTRNQQTDVTVSGDGFVTGEGATYDITGTQTLVGSSSNTFSYTLNSGTLAGNYNISKTEGTLTVTKANAISLTCPPSNSTEKTYDGTVLQPIAQAYGIGDDVIKVEYSTNGTTWSETAPWISHVTTQHVDVRASNPNYDTVTCEYTLKINCRPVTLTSGTSSRKYNGSALTNTNVTVSGSGWLTGKEASYDNFADITNVGSKKNAFTYTLAPGEVATDYCVTIDTGMLTVTCREITLTSGSDTKVYDSTPLKKETVTIGGDGMAPNETLSYTNFASITNVGSISNTFDYNFVSPALAGNYCVSTTNGTLTVTRTNTISLTCPSGTGVEKTYDGTVLQPIAQAYGIGDDVIKIEYSTNGTTWSETAPWISHVTTQHVDVRASNPNYDTVTCEYTLKINCRPVTLTSGTSSRKYNGSALTNTNVTVSGSGWLTGKEASYDNFADITNVGSKKNAFTYTLAPGEVATDYCVTIDTGMLTVTCREITLTSGSDTKVYDSTPLKKETVTIGGDGMAPNETLSYTNFASITNVGSISNTFDYNFVSPALAGNYCVSTTNGTLEVTCKKVTITANSNNKTYDGTPLTDGGFTATPLETGDTHTFVVTMTSGSTITNVGTQTNVIATVDGTPVTTGVETPVGNYCVTTATGTLTVTPAALLIKLDTAKIFDGTPFVSDYMATTDGYTIIGLVPNDYITAGVVTSSAADVNTYIDSVASASADVTTPFATHNGISNYNVTYDLRQVINKKELIITGEFTKVYDGEEFKVYYNQLTYNGLVNGDVITSGVITTDGYRVGDYYCRDNQFHRAMDELRAYNSGFGPTSVTANYTPVFQVVLHIIVRPIEFTAKSGEKVYDGTPLQITDLPAPGYDITSGSIASTDDLTHIDVSGSQLCVGSSASEVANAVIMHGTGSDAEDVTDCYSIRYVDGTLRVTDVTTPLVCPADLTITLWYGRCDTMLTLPEMATVTPSVANTTIVNDLARQNPLPVGTHYITWKLLDACGHAMQTCQQTVTVQYPPCLPVDDYDGTTYPSERIGCDCWTVVNLVSEHYSDGTPIAQYTSYSNSDSLESVYGKLYSWYSAARVPEGDDTAVPVDSLCPTGTYVQGICPAGWALPTVEDYMNMYVASGSLAGLVKSPSTLVWLPGKQGIAPNKFNAYGAGYYDGSLDRYFNLLGETHFWAVDNNTGSSMAQNFVLNYYCESGLFQDANKGLGYSIRCVQRR